MLRQETRPAQASAPLIAADRPAVNGWQATRASQRIVMPEWMDGPAFGRREVEATFRYLSPVDRWFGGIQPFLSFFQRESRRWEPGATVRILDAGAGVGDAALALARWGRRAGFRLQIAAVDKHPVAVELARTKCAAFPEIVPLCQDVFELTGAYDYVITSQFLHHFPDAEVPSVLQALSALARRKVVVGDLIRAPLHYVATWLFSLFASEVFRHDSRLSVSKGFRLPDLARQLESAGFRGFRLERHFFYRFLLILERPAVAGDD